MEMETLKHSKTVKEAETLILERESALCHVLVCYCTVKLVKQSIMVKYSNMVKDWSNKRGLNANIDIFGSLYEFGLHD